ncbi:TRAP transporter, DctQ-like membrane protein [Rhodobacteraceae bacterium KLH11]|nr:TRAP transporter, DctQ-like membrane protein [Rhodobacteraceae bacterium KLH11]
MPSVDFTLPHWLYWVGLIAFPALAMFMARRAQPQTRTYGVPLGYLILVTGGMLGLHRFYLRSLLGLVYLPIFLLILYANGEERTARNEFSNAINVVRQAERVIERETGRVETAEAGLDELRATAEAAQEGTALQKRRAERALDRAEKAIATGRERLQEANADLLEAQPLAEAAGATRASWSSVARYAFYTILALLVVDALLLPRLVARAREKALADPDEPEMEVDAETAARAAELDPAARKADHEYAQNWIDRLALNAGEFVSYWAVIAVFVYYYEVIVRYVFNAPTNWAHESMYLMFGVQYLIAGSYAMLTESHVRVDIFYAPLTKPKRAWADLFTSIFFFIFAGTLLVTSYIFAMDAIAVPTGNSVVSEWARGNLGFFEMFGALTFSDWTDPNIRWGEISFNEWEVPLWPMKWMMVVGAILLILQGVSKLSKDIRTIARGY